MALKLSGDDCMGSAVVGIIRIFFVLFIIFMWPLAASAHEPLFSLGPRTIYKGGIGIEFKTGLLSKSKLFQNGDEISDAKDQAATRLVFSSEIIYGVTRDLAITAQIPVVYRRFEETISGIREKRSSSGLGDVSLRSKTRFWRRDTLGVQESAAIILGIKLPTGDEKVALPLGSGSTDFLFGLTAAHEGRRLYLFGDLRYKLNTEANNRSQGDVFFYDAALGFRPVLTDYYRPDLVLLLEMNGEIGRKDKFLGVSNANSGGEILWVGPNFLLSYRNLMLKGGVRFPVVQDLNGTQLAADYEGVVAVESHY